MFIHSVVDASVKFAACRGRMRAEGSAALWPAQTSCNFRANNLRTIHLFNNFFKKYETSLLA
jgi:hypothetical protein